MLWVARSASFLSSHGCVIAYAAVMRFFGFTVSSFLIRSCDAVEHAVFRHRRDYAERCVVSVRGRQGVRREA